MVAPVSLLSAAEEKCPYVDAAYAAAKYDVPTAGAGVTLVLESRAAATARGATVLATIDSAEAATLPHRLAAFAGPAYTTGAGRLARAEAAALHRRDVVSLADVLPETFAAAPLLALAVGLARGGGRFAVAARRPDRDRRRRRRHAHLNVAGKGDWLGGGVIRP